MGKKKKAANRASVNYLVPTASQLEVMKMLALGQMRSKFLNEETKTLLSSLQDGKLVEVLASEENTFGQYEHLYALTKTGRNVLRVLAATPGDIEQKIALAEGALPIQGEDKMTVVLDLYSFLLRRLMLKTPGSDLHETVAYVLETFS